MADRNRRAAGRKTTPQPTTDRRSRATRSQSREISDLEELPDTKPRKKAESRNLKSNDAVIAEAVESRNTSARNDHDLTVVIEESPIRAAKNSPKTLDGNEKGLRRESANAARKSLGANSAFSGTTARTSNVANELDDGRSENMMDALRSITPEADKVLELLLTGGRWDEADHEGEVARFRDELNSKRSRTRAQFGLHSKMFAIPWEEFDSTTFVDIAAANRALFGADLALNTSHEPWRPDPLLRKINIASLMISLYAPNEPSDDTSLWSLVDEAFPRPLLGEREALNKDARNTVLKLAIEVRTQYLITLIIEGVQDHKSDMLSLVHHAFVESGSMKGWSYETLHGPELDSVSKKTIRGRVDFLKSIIQQAEETHAGGVQIVEKLREHFSWNGFLSNLSQWLKTLLAEIESTVEAYGGSSKILEALQVEIKMPRSTQSSVGGGFKDGISSTDNRHGRHSGQDQEAQAPDPPNNQPPSSSRRAKELSSVAFNPNSPKATRVARALAKRAGLSAAGAFSPKPAGHADPQGTEPTVSVLEQGQTSRSPTDDVQPHSSAQVQDPDDSEDDFAPMSASAIKSITARHASQQAESNKENENHGIVRRARGTRFRYTDAQVDAEQVEWDGGELENRPLQDVTLHRTNRHPGTQDESRKRRSPEVEDDRPSPAKRARQAESQRERDSMPPPSSSSPPPGLPSLTPSDVYQEANSAAKARVASQMKPPQSRKGWTQLETDRLHNLIAAFGCGWARLKMEDAQHPNGPLLEDRDQVALKDKAQNMKSDYIKSIRTLPHPHWENIALRKSLVAKIHALGIPYDILTGRRADFEPYDD